MGNIVQSLVEEFLPTWWATLHDPDPEDDGPRIVFMPIDVPMPKPSRRASQDAPYKPPANSHRWRASNM
jgi:hypothetical protein